MEGADESTELRRHPPPVQEILLGICDTEIVHVNTPRLVDLLSNSVT